MFKLGIVDASAAISLSSASVAVVGLGGLGAGISELLARAGVARLVMMDYGRVEMEHMSQGFYRPEHIGLTKCHAARVALADIAPSLATDTCHGDVADPAAMRLFRAKVLGEGKSVRLAAASRGETAGGAGGVGMAGVGGGGPGRRRAGDGGSGRGAQTGGARGGGGGGEGGGGGGRGGSSGNSRGVRGRGGGGHSVHSNRSGRRFRGTDGGDSVETAAPELRPMVDLLVCCVIDTDARARMNEMCLELRIPMIAAEASADAMAGSVQFVQPGKTACLIVSY